jgi:catechol 2,3-dioxygenase-like lactoylglutathione lyase family enzyme
MALRGLHHVTVICQDLERTKAFYLGVLGLSVVSERVSDDDPDARHIWFGFGDKDSDALISFLEYPDMEPGQVGVGTTHHLALVVDTAEEHEAWFEYLRDRGVRCSEIFDREGFRSIYLRDPDGHIIEIATRGWRFE